MCISDLEQADDVPTNIASVLAFSIPHIKAVRYLYHFLIIQLSKHSLIGETLTHQFQSLPKLVNLIPHLATQVALLGKLLENALH